MQSEITSPKHTWRKLVHKIHGVLSSFISLGKLFYTDRTPWQDTPMTFLLQLWHLFVTSYLSKIYHERKPRGFLVSLKMVVVSISWSENPCSCSEFSPLPFLYPRICLFLPSSFCLKQRQAAKTSEPKVSSGTAVKPSQKVWGNLLSSC